MRGDNSPQGKIFWTFWGVGKNFGEEFLEKFRKIFKKWEKFEKFLEKFGKKFKKWEKFEKILEKISAAENVFLGGGKKEGKLLAIF